MQFQFEYVPNPFNAVTVRLRRLRTVTALKGLKNDNGRRPMT